MEERTHRRDHALVTIQLDAPLSDAIELMTARDVRHLPVLDGSKLVGIVSERDLTMIESLMPRELGTVQVAEAMTPEPYVVRRSARLAEVVRNMAERKYGCVLVVDDEGVLADIFTSTDALLLLSGAAGDRSIGEALGDKTCPTG